MKGDSDMEEVSYRVNYGEWDKVGFEVPAECVLTEENSLYDAVKAFYLAGGYDFFKVVDPRKYGERWLEFIGNLYVEIDHGMYKEDGLNRENPLDAQKRKDLCEQGVPDIFTRDLL